MQNTLLLEQYSDLPQVYLTSKFLIERNDHKLTSRVSKPAEQAF